MTETAPQHMRHRAADDLVAAFEDKIILGELKDGEPLPAEREIVHEFGVSRTVVREALGTLSNRGLVEARPGFRPIVRRPSYDAVLHAVDSQVRRLLVTPDGIGNLFDIRILLEAALVREAATKADRATLANLKTALDANHAAIGDSEAFYETDVAFHRAFYRIDDNPVLPSIHRACTSWLSPQWTQMPRSPERNQANHEAHKAIFEAILMRDPDAAETALRDHLESAWQQVRSTFPGDSNSTQMK